MSNLYLLDTDTISYQLRGGNPVLSRRLRVTPHPQILVSAVTEAELRYGIKRYPVTHPRHIDVTLLLEVSNLTDWTSAAASAYADIRHSLTLTGQLIGELDMMIAAHALALDATLVTNNTRHYQRIAPLRLENWTQE